MQYLIAAFMAVGSLYMTVGMLPEKSATAPVFLGIAVLSLAIGGLLRK